MIAKSSPLYLTRTFIYLSLILVSFRLVQPPGSTLPWLAVFGSTYMSSREYPSGKDDYVT
jgi:hypothetical protein